MANYLRLEMQGRDMNAICRLCLGENVELLHVSESKGIPGWTAAIAINELLRFEVSSSDVYPKFICTECMGRLVDFKLFKRQCESNKDLLDRRNREVGHNEEAMGMDFSRNDKSAELYIKEEEIVIEADPIDMSEEEEEGNAIKAEIEESSNGNYKASSADHIYRPIKCELSDRVSSVDTDEIIIPDNTSTTEAMRVKVEYPDAHSPSESIVYSDHKVKEEPLDITIESCSNSSFEEERAPELTGHVNSKAVFSQGMTGYSYSSCVSSDDRLIGPQHYSRGPSDDPPRSSCVGGIFGNGGKVPKSNIISSYTDRTHSSCNVPLNLRAGKDFFQQAECSQAVRKQSNVVTHQKVCAEDGLFMCTHCCETFSEKQTLKEHLFHSGDGRFVCSECSLTFHCENKLGAHILTHSTENPLKFTELSNSLSSEDKFKEHAMAHSPDKQFRCTLCDKAYSNKGNLKRHMMNHSAVEPFHCSVCSKAFLHKDKLKVHMNIHSEDKPYKCTDCGKSFSQRDALRVHMRIHSGERPYACVQCGKCFSSTSSVKIHMAVHSEDRPYSCKECGKSFSLLSTLNGHKKVHSGVKPCKCGECGAAFSSNRNLRRHMMSVHSEEKPYKCTECSKSFSQEGNLRVHMRIHSGERPYKCDQCNKSFPYTSSLKKHSQICSGP